MKTKSGGTAVVLGKVLDRRTFLKGSGVLLGLPLLSAMQPAFAKAGSSAAPVRLLAICNNLGMIPEYFFPSKAGAGYELPPSLLGLKDHQQDFTVMSGVSHPNVDGGHPADNCFLTAAAHPGNGGFRNTISLDQFAAARIGHLTRFPSLTLGVNVARGSKSLSWTNSGALIPCEEKPSAIFKRLFVQGTPAEVAAQKKRLAVGRSIMDTVSDQAKALGREVGPRDRERLDQYYTGVRDLEKRMAMAGEWEDRPKPVVSVPPPADPPGAKDYVEKIRLLYDLCHLAFETDSTRLITLMLDSVNSPTIEVPGAEITDGYHSLSHHGRSPAKMKQLGAIDAEHMKQLATLLGTLKGVREDDQALLDRTMILYGSNLGNANTHVTTNLPILFAGGAFRHGQHLVFNRENNYPLPNLFVTMLQKMGLEVDRFASSTGTFQGLS